MIRTLPITIRDFDLNEMIMSVAKTLYQWQVRAEQRQHLGTLDRRPTRPGRKPASPSSGTNRRRG